MGRAKWGSLTHSLTHSLLKLKRFFGWFARKSFVFLLIFSLLFSQFSFLIPSVYAASSSWTQTDWSGGSGQTSWSDSTKFDSSSNVTTSTAGQATLTATSGWCNNASCTSSWAYRKKITFNNTDANLGVTSENLTNFPVLVKLSSSNIDYTKTQDSGQDIRFTDTDGSDLAYEIEKWDETGTSWVWVKVPQIDINSSTDYIYLYYGNTSAADHQQATSVWNSNYVMVQHLAETSGTNTNDSTSNNNDGTKVSATEPNPTTSGQIDGAQDFDGSNDYVSAGTNQIPSGSSHITISYWQYQRTNTSQMASVSLEGTVGDTFTISVINLGGTYYIWTDSTAENFTVTAAQHPPLNQWVYVSLNYDGTKINYYKDGVFQTSYTTSLNTGSLSSNYIGQRVRGATGNFNGTIDEVRISNTARSAAWIAASYKSESDAFNTIASEEQVYSSTPGTLTSSIFDTEYTAGAAWGTLTYNATTPSNTSVSVKARTSNSSSMTGATAFSSCNAITSASDISSNNCVTDSHRYIQYQLSLANTDSVSTPTFQDISVAFSAYDTTPPSISLTALSPDPNNDNTPALTGTATDAVGTVSNVQFQMDSTSGSWTACTANDGSFNSASEAFTCTVSSALSDGSHTMYVRATDSNGNTTASGSYASDSFTIDATAPVSIDLDSPGDNGYTNNERPSFKWKATTDATAGLSKYVLEIDNPSLGTGQPSGDFTIDDIPTSRTTDYETNKYIIHYENFSDSDSTNNYISVYTKSSSEWSTDSNSGQNDGKLREGKVGWKVKARDSVGNETSSSRTLFVDRSSPKVEFTQVNDTPFSLNNFSTTDKTPTLYGRITDSLTGGDSNQTQDENGPKIASGPKQVEIKIEKKEGLTYKLHTLYTINMDKPWYTCDNKELSDNSKQKCDKYLPFEYTPKDTLDFGTYKITLTGKDKADNVSSESSFTLNITTLAQIITPEEKKTIEEEIKDLPKEEQEKVKEELEITKPVESSALEKTGEKIAQTSKNILATTGNIISGIFNGIGRGVKFAFNTTGKALAFVGNKTGQALSFIGRTTSNTLMALYNGTQSILAYMGQGIGNGANVVDHGLAFAGEKIGLGFSTVAQGTGNLLASIGQEIGNTGKAIGDGYNQLANNAPGITKTILTGIGNGVSTTANFFASTTSTVATTTVKIAQNIAVTIGNAANSVATATSTIAQNTGKAIANATNTVVAGTTTLAKSTSSVIAKAAQNTTKTVKSGIANIAFAVGEKTQGVAGDFSLALVKFAYNFVPEPTKISDVQVAVLSPTSVKVTWQTNHPANGKVNYGFRDGDYDFEEQMEKRTTYHEFVLENLKPDTEYHYEVMSQNKNYVYDASRKFKTPAIAGAEKQAE